MRAERRTKKKGSGVEFADHRNYAPGDDFRYLDWNVYQRFGKLLVRLYEEEEDLSIYFLVDCSTLDGLRRRQQVRPGEAALRGARVRRAREPRSRHDRRRERRGRSRACRRRAARAASSRCSTSCAGSSPTARPTRESLKTFVAQHKRRGLAVLISDLYDPAGFEGGINVLRYNKFEPFVLHIVDPREAQPDAARRRALYDCETGDEREVTVTPKLLERMQQRLGRVPRPDRALLHHAAGPVLSRRRGHARSTSSSCASSGAEGFLR